MNRFTRVIAAIAAAGVAVALAPSVASGAVPFASWYWSLAVPSSSPNVILLATSKGVYRSTDAGKSWQVGGLSGVDTTSLVQSGNSIFAGGARVSASAKPVLVKNGTYTVTPGPPVLAVSTNAGATWSVLHPKGLPSVAVQALAVDPSDSQTMDAVLRNGTIYRTTDGARTFQRLSSKIGGTPWALAITQANHLVAGNMTTGSYLGASADQWQHTSFVDPRGSKMVMEYAVQPSNPSHVLMTSYGIVASNDSGKSWHVVLKSKVMFGPVAWTSTSKVAYAVGWDQSIWRSGNGGATWSRVA